MENKGTKKIMLDDEELEQVSGGIGGGEQIVGDTVKALYNAELKVDIEYKPPKPCDLPKDNLVKR